MSAYLWASPNPMLDKIGNSDIDLLIREKAIQEGRYLHRRMGRCVSSDVQSLHRTARTPF